MGTHRGADQMAARSRRRLAAAIAEIGVPVDVVEQTDRDDLGGVVELGDNARNTHTMRHEWLAVSLKMGGIQGGQELVGAVNQDQILEHKPLLAELVIELKIRLRDLHPLHPGQATDRRSGCI